MRKLIMWNLMTLDGFVEGPNRDISWHNDIWGPELEGLSKEQGWEIGGLVFGRVTYELMAAHWPTAPEDEIAGYMNALPKYVFSRTLAETPWRNSRLMRGAPAEEIAKLKREVGKNLFMFGSADLSSQILPLFDELRIGLCPMRLGAGTPLFRQGGPAGKMTLLETRPLSNGVVILRYAPQS